MGRWDGCNVEEGRLTERLRQVQHANETSNKNKNQGINLPIGIVVDTAVSAAKGAAENDVFFVHSVFSSHL